MRSHLLAAVVLGSLGTGCSSGQAPDDAATQNNPESGVLDGRTTEGAFPPGADSAQEAGVADVATFNDAADEMTNEAGEGGFDDAMGAPLDASSADDGAQATNASDAGLPMCTTCGHGTCAQFGCACDVGWGGSVCDMAAPVLVPGVPASGSVTRGHWAYFSFEGMASGVSATLTEDSSVGLVWAYLGAVVAPDQSNHLAANEDTQSSTHTVSRTYAGPNMQAWYVGAYGQPGIPTDTQVVPFHITITVIP